MAKEGIPGSSSFSWGEELMIVEEFQELPPVQKEDVNESLSSRIHEGMCFQTRTKEDKAKIVKTFISYDSDIDNGPSPPKIPRLE